MNRMELSRSIDIKPCHFQKDVIIPQIYNLENIKLIQSCGYPESPINKVAQLKKRNIQSAINAIINKPQIDAHENKRKKIIKRPTSRKSQYDEKPYKEIFEQNNSQALFMDIDQKIGQAIAIMEENFAPTAQRIQGTIAKVSKYLKNRQLEQKERDVMKYINILCSSSQRKKTNPQKSQKKVKGLIEELDDLQKSGAEFSKKRRVQSAKIIYNTPQSESFLMRQSKSRLIQRPTSNLHQKRKLTQQIAKSKQLITMINNCIGQEDKRNQAFDVHATTMKGEWSEGCKLQKTFLRTKNTSITQSTLNLLRQKRLRQQALNRIDNQTFKKS